MTQQFTVITTLCYGKDNEIVEELESHVSQSIIFDPETEAWILGEWGEEE